ncbi:ArgE/DapE family deacylase [Candidatus Bathyarchaeota archaeon]|nr:ArgE/DapE family deacylase [Candidatus Bathyarchaeota archaeon]
MSIEERILDHIESERDEVVSFMQKLIQTPSVTGEEAEIGALMEKECSRDGLNVDLVEPQPGRVSVVASHTGTGGGPRMMMYSHYDVVPPGDPDTWRHPAFGAEIHDGYIWGRGAQDNKIATCGLTMAYRAIKELGIKLKGDIVFTHVADEERGGRYGFQEVLNRGYGNGVDYLFYAHGGDPDTIGVAANGSRGASITVRGRGAHTARLEEGVNAIAHAAGLVTELQKLAYQVNTREYHLPGTDSVMRSRFSVNRISGGVANNNVPDTCTVYVDRRYTPGETEEQVDGEYEEAIRRAKQSDPALEVEYTVQPGNLVSVAPADSPLVKGIQRAAGHVGYAPKPMGGSHSSDHGWFVRRHGKPFASYGIGGEGVHSANERIRVEDVIATTKVYALSMMNILGADE